MTDEESVFSRWSRRKRTVETEKPPEEEIAPEPVVEEIAEPATDEEEVVLLERLGLPKPESLGEGDDFAPFMKSGVPEFLRRRALRVLWRSNPVLANLDGLNDYDDDFNSPELTQKVLATGYQVGRGFARKVAALIEDDDEPLAERESDDPVETEVTESNSNDLEVPSSDVKNSEAEPEAAPRPRRMRFET
jgi:hypothetical protein